MRVYIRSGGVVDDPRGGIDVTTGGPSQNQRLDMVSFHLGKTVVWPASFWMGQGCDKGSVYFKVEKLSLPSGLGPNDQGPGRAHRWRPRGV